MYVSMLDTDDERSKLEELYNSHKLTLLLYAKKILNDPSAAEDAVHSTFLAIIERKEKYLALEKRNLRALSVSIVRSKCIDILRKQRPYSDMPLDELELYIESAEKSVGEQVEISSEFDEIYKHLAAVDELAWQVLVMRYYHGMSYDEISEATGMTAKQIGNKIMRAKVKVRKLLDREVGGNGQ